MGGQNHQPCNKYLDLSIMLSRHLSAGASYLDLGNVALEDILLAEHAGHTGLMEPVTDRLSSSIAQLNNALNVCRALRERMTDNDFVDLPTLASTDLHQLGLNLAAQNFVSPTAWARTASIMADGGFSAMLSHIETSVDMLLRLTHRLRDITSSLTAAVQERQMTAILEGNRPGNIKAAFAALYTAWADFKHLFLASSLLSTELWYAYTGAGSLCVRSHARGQVA